MTIHDLRELVASLGIKNFAVSVNKSAGTAAIRTNEPLTDQQKHYIYFKIPMGIEINYTIQLPGIIRQDVPVSFSITDCIVSVEEEVLTGNPYVDNALADYQKFCKQEENKDDC